MKAEEKWRRLSNPVSIEDYGLSVTEDEMREFPEGRKILCGMKKMQRSNNFMKRHLRNAGAMAAQTMDSVAYDVLCRSKQ